MFMKKIEVFGKHFYNDNDITRWLVTGTCWFIGLWLPLISFYTQFLSIFFISAAGGNFSIS